MNGFGRGDDKKTKDKGIFTKETIGMTLMLFSGILFFIAVTGKYIFGEIGLSISAFLIGTFGFFVYPLLVLVFYLSLRLVSGKKLLPAAWVVRVFLVVACVFFIVHTATAERFYDASYGSYLSGCFGAAGESLAAGTGGGAVFGLIAFPVRYLLSEAGAFILFSLLTLLSVFYLLLLTPFARLIGRAPRSEKKGKERKEKEKEGKVPLSFDDLETPAHAPMLGAAPREPYPMPAPPMPVPPPVREPAAPTSREILFRGDPASDYRNNLIYDKNSAFNRTERSSTVGPSYPSAPSAPAAPSSYSGDFSAAAETPRPPMPRRVVAPEQSADDFNYPAASFRAPSEEMPVHDPYSHDVETEFSSAPNIYDAPELPEEREPVRPSFRAPDAAPAPEPPRTFLDPFGGRERAPEPLAPPSREEPFDRRGAGDGELFGSRRDSSFDLGEQNRRDTGFDLGEQNRRDSGFDLGEQNRRDSGFDLGEQNRRDSSFDLGEQNRRDTGFDLGEQNRRDTSFDLGEQNRRDTSFDLGRQSDEDGADEPTELSPRDSGDAGDVFEARGRSDADLFDDDLPPAAEEKAEEAEVPARSVRGLSSGSEKSPEQPKKKHVWKKYKKPDIDLLNTYDDKVELSNEIIGRTSGIILDTLRNYKIDTHIIGVKAGPAVTRYDLAMPQNGTISQMTRYEDEIALYLEVAGVNMYANPEVRGISIEVPVPKDQRATVGLKSIIQSDEFTKSKPDALTFALGKDIEGRNVCGNITEMTHILVAGMTGSGKSVTMHAMLISMLYKYSPEELRLILIDPKQTEFTIYEGLPHLMINEIITQPQRAVTALNWAIKEMERRYTLFNEKTRSGLAVSKLDEYNANLVDGEERLPKIVIVVDEFGDLMLIAKKEIEERIQRLAQKARAAGIHLVLATQRPDATVITGVIKSNLPTRISLSVDSELNSRIMLDEGGAEHLLGNGDMLIKMGGKARRAQGAFLSPVERLRVVNFIKENNEAYFDDSVAEYIDKDGDGGAGGGSSFDGDGGNVGEQYIRALATVIKVGQASISLIQRKCGVGYNHAGKIIEWMEAMGYISAFEGAKARTVLLTKEEFEAKYGSID